MTVDNDDVTPICRNPFLIRSVIPTLPTQGLGNLSTYPSQSLLNQVSDSYGSSGKTRKTRRPSRNPFLIRSVIPTELGVEEGYTQHGPSQSLLNQVSDSYWICPGRLYPGHWKGRNPFLIRSVIPTQVCLGGIRERRLTTSQSLLNQVSDSYMTTSTLLPMNEERSQSLLNQVSDSYKTERRRIWKKNLEKSQSLLNQVSDSYRCSCSNHRKEKRDVAIPS